MWERTSHPQEILQQCLTTHLGRKNCQMARHFPALQGTNKPPYMGPTKREEENRHLQKCRLGWDMLVPWYRVHVFKLFFSLEISDPKHSACDHFCHNQVMHCALSLTIPILPWWSPFRWATWLPVTCHNNYNCFLLLLPRLFKSTWEKCRIMYLCTTDGSSCIVVFKPRTPN